QSRRPGALLFSGASARMTNGDRVAWKWAMSASTKSRSTSVRRRARGMPMPAPRSSSAPLERSNTTTSHPARPSAMAAADPARGPPTMATLTGPRAFFDEKHSLFECEEGDAQLFSFRVVAGEPAVEARATRTRDPEEIAGRGFRFALAADHAARAVRQ